VGLVTLHRYGLDRCDVPAPAVTLGQLLSAGAQEGIANSVAPSTRTAHAHRVPIRIEEMNAVACGGQAGVSDTFGAALWALEALFESARVGVDGVNVHTRGAGLNSLFTARVCAGHTGELRQRRRMSLEIWQPIPHQLGREHTVGGRPQQEGAPRLCLPAVDCARRSE
jgi:hypothetical protein